MLTELRIENFAIIDQLELLKKQGGVRSRAVEERLVVEAMIDHLRRDATVLLVCDPVSFVRFHSAEAAAVMRAEGVSRPRTYLWIVANAGQLDHRFVLFSNKPPPWPEPVLPFSRESLEKNGFSMDAVEPTPAASNAAKAAPTTSTATSASVPTSGLP